MRVIKLGFISLIAFAMLITFISFLFPSKIRISKAIDINADREELMSQLEDTANWRNWYPGIDSAESFPVITAVTDSSVTASSTMANGRKGVTGWNVYRAAIPNMITVQWYMDFHLRWYPWEKFSSLLFEKRFGPVMERGLEKLKALFAK
ncbi:MAG: hypothetical protein ACT4OJ_05460 [Bacteroidota bacterium]